MIATFGIFIKIRIFVETYSKTNLRLSHVFDNNPSVFDRAVCGVIPHLFVRHPLVVIIVEDCSVTIG